VSRQRESTAVLAGDALANFRKLYGPLQQAFEFMRFQQALLSSASSAVAALIRASLSRTVSQLLFSTFIICKRPSNENCSNTP